MAERNTQPDHLSRSTLGAAEEELRRRRERGRLSQARFRKRQAQSSREMREENQTLKAAIADIARATRRNDRPNLLRTVRAAAEAASIDTSILDDESREYGAPEEPEFPEWGATTQRSLSPVSSSDSACRTDESAVADSYSARRSQNCDISTPNHQSRGRARRPCLSTSPSQSPLRSGRLSPRLDYGIWVDASRAVRIAQPPVEIIPFLGAGRYTFAGQLYWACADYIISLCRVVTAPNSPSPWFNGRPQERPNPREAEHRLWRVLQHTPPLRNVRLAQALAEAQREYRDHGFIWGDSPASNPDVGVLLRKEIESNYAARGDDLSVWMTITQLEKHMQRQLGDEAFSRLDKAMARFTTCVEAAGEESAADPDVCAVVKLLIKNLAESYTCFGDGPRWRADCVSALFSEKMKTQL
ncbi:hypothetical protein F5Y19DRAFT_227909 [Xylariaceae sp. FL1651]|nr:hypothetical protein F5Y19DRAFT_227909 [Xylariaceae sp. FL1651]